MEHSLVTSAAGTPLLTFSASAQASLERQYRDLFEGALLGIYVSTPDGRLAACNAAFAEMLGFASIADAVGADMSVFYRDAVGGSSFARRLREPRSGAPRRERLIRRDGTLVDVIETVVAAFDAAGMLIELRGFLIDVSGGLETAHAVEQRDRQVHAVFDEAADAMLILDDDGVIRDANQAAIALFGLTRDALEHRRFDTLVVGDVEEFNAAWRELLMLGEARREHRIAAGSRPPRLVECSYRARVQGNGHLCIARDITDRRLLEERVTQSEKIESVGRLAGGIAHDFNNLLTAILGYTELLLSQRKEDDPDRADLEEIQKAGQRAAALTQQLLAFSRKQVLLPKQVDLNQTVVSLKSMLARLIREDITLTCHVDAAPAIVRIDPTQVEQVILNLVLNARDALPCGGHIRLEVATVSAADLDAALEPPAAAEKYVRLRVIDDGVGMTPEARGHLFEPFFTTKTVGKGTGLGLASVYGIVRQSNGFITVETAPDAGTTFTMHFPAAQELGEPAAVDAAPAPPPTRGNETVLLVEDEDAVRVIITAVLQRQGYQVLSADTPHAAIEIFERRHRDVDLLLTDVVMPEMNGPALAQRLVAIRPELRILFISGYAGVSLPLGAGGSNIGFLSKPFEATVLAAKVRELLMRARAS